MNSVSSNAVYKNGWDTAILSCDPSVNNPLLFIDAQSTISVKCIKFRLISQHTYSSPYGDDKDTDFYYEAYRLDGGAWARVIAYDVRSNRQYYISKTDGVWGLWSSYVDFHPEGNYINGGQAKLHATRTENMVQLSIDAFSGTTGIPKDLAVHVATIAPAPLIITQLTVRTDGLGGYARAWLNTAGHLWVYISYENYSGNIAIGGTYICP